MHPESISRGVTTPMARHSTLPVGGLFVFIGATPSTEWLNGQLAVGEDGFLLTGADIPAAQLESVAHVPLLTILGHDPSCRGVVPSFDPAKLAGSYDQRE